MALPDKLVHDGLLLIPADLAVPAQFHRCRVALSVVRGERQDHVLGPHRLERAVLRPVDPLVAVGTEHERIELEVEAVVIPCHRIQNLIVVPLLEARRPVRPACQSIAVAGEHVVGHHEFGHVVRIRYRQLYHIARTIVGVQGEHQILHPDRLQLHVAVVVDVRRDLEHDVSAAVLDALQIAVARFYVAGVIDAPGRVRPADERIALADECVRHERRIAIGSGLFVPRERHRVHLAFAAVRVEGYVVSVQLPHGNERDVGIRHRLRKLGLPADLPAVPVAYRRVDRRAVFLRPRRIDVRPIHERHVMLVRDPLCAQHPVLRPSVVRPAEHAGLESEVRLVAFLVVFRLDPVALASCPVGKRVAFRRERHLDDLVLIPSPVAGPAEFDIDHVPGSVVRVQRHDHVLGPHRPERAVERGLNGSSDWLLLFGFIRIVAVAGGMVEDELVVGRDVIVVPTPDRDDKLHGLHVGGDPVPVVSGEKNIRVPSTRRVLDRAGFAGVDTVLPCLSVLLVEELSIDIDASYARIA